MITWALFSGWHHLIQVKMWKCVWVFPVTSWRRYCVRLLLTGYTCIPCQGLFILIFSKPDLHTNFPKKSTRLCCWVISADFCYCWSKMFVVLPIFVLCAITNCWLQMCDIHVSLWIVVSDLFSFFSYVTDRKSQAATENRFSLSERAHTCPSDQSNQLKCATSTLWNPQSEIILKLNAVTTQHWSSKRFIF